MRVVNAPSRWVRKDGAFVPIVSQELFYRAQGIIQARSRRFTDEELLQRLKTLLADRGYLSGLVINEAENMPSSSAYAHRFGSLIRAYELVGFTPERDYSFLETNRLLRRLHPEILSQTEQKISALGGVTYRNPLNDLVDVNREFKVSIVLARCQTLEAGGHRWKVRFDSGLSPDLTVAVRLAPGNDGPLDYYLLPRLDFAQIKINLADQNAVELESYRFDTLDYLYGMAARTRLRRAA